MNPIFIIFQKETSDFLKSTVVVLFLTGVLTLSSYFFLSSVFLNNQASLTGFFIWLPLLWIILLPALTFDLWAQEYKFITIDLLNALPLPWHNFAIGKFFAATFIMSLALALTTPLVVTFALLAQLDIGPIFSAELGVWCNGIFCLSLGLLFSRISKNSIVSYLATVLSLLVLTVLSHPLITQILPTTFRALLETASLDENFKPFLEGIISFKSILFLMGFSTIFLILQSLRNCTFSSLTKVLLTSGLLFILCNEIPLSWSIDATANKRHSLSQATQNVLNSLNDTLTVKLYFSNKLPFEIQKIEDSLLNELRTFKQHSPKNIFIEFVNIDTKVEQEHAIQLGIQPLTLHVVEQNSQNTQDVFMGATLHYQDRISILPALIHPENFAYQLTLQILKLQTVDYPKIGVLLPEGLGRKDFSSALTVLDQLGDVVLVENTQEHLADLQIKILIIIDPTNLPTRQSQEIDDLLKHHVPVLIFASPSVVSDAVTVQFKNTGLENFLSQHGLKITKELLLDDVNNAKAQFDLGTSQVELNYPFWLKLSSTQFSTSDPVTSGLTTLLIPWTHALEFDNAILSPTDCTVLIESTPDSFLQEPHENSISPQYVSKMQNLPLVEKYPLAVSLKLPEFNAPLFVMSSYQFLKNNFLNPTYFIEAEANATFFANLVEYQTWGNQLIGLRSQNQPIGPLPQISLSQKKNIQVWLMLFAFFAPILVWAATLVYQSKRHKAYLKLILNKR